MKKDDFEEQIGGLERELGQQRKGLKKSRNLNKDLLRKQTFQEKFLEDERKKKQERQYYSRCHASSQRRRHTKQPGLQRKNTKQPSLRRSRDSVTCTLIPPFAGDPSYEPYFRDHN